MATGCDLTLSEHRDAGHTTCQADRGHAEALARRLGGARAWDTIERGRDAGGARDYLAGRPINCGRGLLLQGQRLDADDYGEFALRTEDAVRVRYETEGDTIVLFAELGGHVARIRYHAGMRFRWPEESRIFG